MAKPMVALNQNATLERKKDYVRPHVKQDKPAYGIINNGFFDNKDKFWNPGEALYYEEEPSLNMVPLNKLGHERMTALFEKLNALGNEKAKKDKSSYTPMTLAPWSEDESNDDFPQPDSVMGMRKDGENKAIR